MLKIADSLKEAWALEAEAADALASVLATIPIVSVENIKRNVSLGPHKFDRPMQKEAFDWFERYLKS